ncbi:MAG: GNAT family N-acetyltransferase [Leptospirales bacterium]|nr:GNAT family N-acetyltransferase [Leptospirales bacterium]
MELGTENLRILALNEEQFALLLSGVDKLEAALGIDAGSEALEPPVRQALLWLYERATGDKENFLWYTSWQFILKSMNILAGSACFLGPPDADGKVELSYGLRKFCRFRGYDEEALSAMCAWAASRGAAEIVSETDADDYGAHKIFETCGFEIQSRGETCFWRKDIRGFL